jgi:hypothetical protein
LYDGSGKAPQTGEPREDHDVANRPEVGILDQREHRRLAVEIEAQVHRRGDERRKLDDHVERPAQRRRAHRRETQIAVRREPHPQAPADADRRLARQSARAIDDR